ncbi:hypothetical protein ACE6H2_025921 [Prunus campanulata]
MPSFQCVQQFLEPVKVTGKPRGAKKAAASKISELTPSKLNNIHHYVRGTWQHGWLDCFALFRRRWHECCLKCSFMKVLSLKRLSKGGYKCQALRHSQFAPLEMYHNNEMGKVCQFSRV